MCSDLPIEIIPKAAQCKPLFGLLHGILRFELCRDLKRAKVAHDTQCETLHNRETKINKNCVHMLHGCHFILAQTGHGGSNAKARAVKKHACYSRGSQNTCRGNPTQTAAINAQLQSSTLTVSTYCTHFVAKSRIGRPQQQLGPGARLCAQPAGPVQGLTLTSELPTCQGMPGDVTDPFKRQDCGNPPFLGICHQTSSIFQASALNAFCSSWCNHKCSPKPTLSLLTLMRSAMQIPFKPAHHSSSS